MCVFTGYTLAISNSVQKYFIDPKGYLFQFHLQWPSINVEVHLILTFRALNKQAPMKIIENLHPRISSSFMTSTEQDLCTLQSEV